MQNLINRFVVKRQDLIVDDCDVKGVLEMINENISVWHRSVRVGRCGNHSWRVNLHATNDEWTILSDKLRNGGFLKVLHKCKVYHRV